MPDLVAYLSKDHIEVVNLSDMRASSGAASFTTNRLLVGNFPEAEALLIRLVNDVSSNGIFTWKPRLVVQPLEMTEGGLSVVEERVFLELGAGTGARQVKVHVGDKLSTEAAIELLESRS